METMKRIWPPILLAFMSLFFFISSAQAQYPQQALNQYVAELQKNPNDKKAAARQNISGSDKQQFNPSTRAPEAVKYECPETRYINCMPLVKESDKDKCAEDYLEWVKSHCPGVQVVY